MPVDLNFIEEDIDKIEIEDNPSMDLYPGELFVRYANSNHPQTIEEVFENPTEEGGEIHAYIGFYLGSVLPPEEEIPTLFTWSVRDLTAIQETLAQLGNDKQDKLTAGSGIDITNNVISCTSQGKIYSAGNGLQLDDSTDTFSIDETVVATKQDLTSKQDTIEDLDAIKSGAAKGATAVQPEAGKGLFSGSYDDLTDKPTIPAAQVNSDWNATSGVAQILNKPTIPDISNLVPNIRKVGGITLEVDTENLKDYTYDIDTKEEYIIEDGHTYTLPTEYDLSTFPQEDISIYEDNIIKLEVYYFEGAKGVQVTSVENPDDYYWYDENDNCWMIYDSDLEESIPYTEDINVTIYEDNILDRDLLIKVLDIEPAIITTRQDLEDKFNEDIKDWTYDTITKEEVIIDEIVEGDTYTLPQEYDLSEFTFPATGDEPLALYEYPSTPVTVLLVNSNDTNIISIRVGSNIYAYVNFGNDAQWYIMQEGQPSPYSGEINVTIADLNAITPGKEEELRKVLGLTTHTINVKVKQKLEEKFNEIDEKIKLPLKNWLYDELEVNVQPLFTPNWNNFPNDFISHTQQEPLVIYQDSNMTVGIYGTPGSAYQIVPSVIFRLDNGDYYTTEILSSWTCKEGSSYTTLYSQSEMPIITYDKQYIVSGYEELFKSLLYIPIVYQSLEEKFNEGIKDWKYSEVELKDNQTYDIKMSNIDIVISEEISSGTNIAYSVDGIELCYYSLDTLDDEMCINYYRSEAPMIDLYYSTSLGKWLEYTGDEYTGDSLTFTVDISRIEDEEALRKILEGLGNISLEKKLDEIQPPYTITDYTETGGDLTSITVKNKETGEPTVLTVGGGGSSNQYIHHLTIYGGTNYKYFTLDIKTDSNASITYSDLRSYLSSKGFTYPSVKGVNGTFYFANTNYTLTGIYAYDNSILLSYADGSMQYNSQTLENNINIDDNVE